ncbi:DNA binding protein [Cronobacter phage JC01]|uniref:DNA binding protein n=1 Tax=Cronobacter phage JC01 TaxID=2729575 RepID=A0A6M3YNL4_9CAUD|nr:DNA binding protein [Cronobacter phage JC01]QJI52225.1 DNA binding protein [Cronobacter phage JC01]
MAEKQKLVVAKRMQGGVVYTNGMIRLDEVILSYPHLDEMWAGETGDKPAYSAEFLAPKETHREIIKEALDICRKLASEKKLNIAGDKMFVKDGDKWFEHKPECAGRFKFTAREQTHPTVRRADGSKMHPKDDKAEIKEMFYGGCIVSALINPWVQNNSYGKRINANLKAVRFVRDGEPFGEGRVDDDEAWDDDVGGGDDWDSGDAGSDDDF